MLYIFLIVAILCATYFLVTDIFNYWKRKNVPQPNVSYIFGNIGDSVLLKRSLGLIFADIYNQFKDLKYVGIYNFRIPSLLIRDTELIKDILIKDFDSFQDNDIALGDDSILSKNPFVLKGQEWKVVRTQLTPCFSSGKMKSLFPLMNDCSRRFADYVEKEQKSKPNEGLDVKELSSNFTTENIASCAFGLEGKCFEDPHAEFRQIGRELLTPSLGFAIKTTILLLLPSLHWIFQIKLFPDHIAKRLSNIILNTLKYRNENKIVRNDFLQIMNNYKSKTNTQYPFTDNDIVGHAAGFFSDGFETSSIALSFMLYELASNTDVQEKLRQEIDEAFEKCQGNLTYEILQDMSYLDCVVTESLRMHPPAMFLKKACTKRTVLQPPKKGGKEVVIEPKTPIVIPLYGIQHDEQYYPEPERFNPDRFLGENKANIPKFTYLTFGEGPRQCIGQRFAYLQIKLGLTHIVRNFEMRVNKKTKTPIEIDPIYFMLAAKGGLWLNFKKIANK